MKKILVPICLFLFAGANAQTTVKDYTQANVGALALEVFRDYPIYAGSEYLPIYKHRLDRVSVIVEPYAAGEAYPLLSSVPLLDKYNTDLGYDVGTFDLNTFNPMKYIFDFESSQEKKYRVDQTDYVVSVAPKN